jgi:Carboxypeptidase regulatory-like domain
MSWPDRMRQDRRGTNRLVLWVALTLLALLTSCSSGQSPDNFGGRPGIVQGTERYALVMLQVTAALKACEPTTDASNTGVGDNVISGHAFDADGQPIEGVCIYIRTVPESDGAVHQTTTDADGAYSYKVPDGDYLILAEYNPNDEPGGGDYLEPVSGDGSVTVPPSAVVDFSLP